ncbi:MAG: hypothetical protein JWO09_253 [Bacteroidetes bacterium]|nr:hypothetical protein [Bacteroidota bacterium]
MERFAAAFIILLLLSASPACTGSSHKPEAPALEDSFLYSQPADSLRLAPASALHCFYSAKLDTLLAEHAGKDGKTSELTDKELAALDVTGIIVFAHQHPEQYLQSCSIYFKELSYNTKIHSSLPRKGEGFYMSDRQYQLLKDHRDSVLLLFNRCFENASAIPDDYKTTVCLLSGYECIPSLKKMIARQQTKDTYILTLFMILMNQDKYAPFAASDLHKKLYDETREDYQYDMTVPVNKKNYDEIMAFASAYYEFKKAG